MAFFTTAVTGVNCEYKQGENLVYVDSPHKINMVKS